MDGIKVGDHFIPLPNSPRYGPKRWRQEMRGTTRTFIEIELTPLDRLQSDLAGCSEFFDHTKPITEVDAEADPALSGYIGGCAVFPKAGGFDISTPEGAARAAKQESEWEARSLAMHKAQVPIQLDAKPESNILAEIAQAKIALERGD